jgi:hypothetical protein
METVLIVTTIVSVALAAGMGMLAWRLARAERLRSQERVAALAADLREFDVIREQTAVGARSEPARVHQVTRRAMDFDTLELRSGPVAVPPSLEMFRTESATGSKSRLATVLAIGTFAVATSLALIIATGRGAPRLADAAALPSAPGPSSGAAPLELVSLSHEWTDDQITIHGLVRNPPDGEKVDQLTAVVYLFDQDGSILETGTAPVGVRSLASGSESAFVVKAGHAAAIRRYRVSFKIGDRVVPHLDRRQGEPANRPDR